MEIAKLTSCIVVYNGNSKIDIFYSCMMKIAKLTSCIAVYNGNSKINILYSCIMEIAKNNKNKNVAAPLIFFVSQWRVHKQTSLELGGYLEDLNNLMIEESAGSNINPEPGS